VAKSMSEDSKLPNQASDAPVPSSRHRHTREELEAIVAGTEKGIRDTYAWKNLVRRVGLNEARRILKLGLLAGQLPGTNPKN